jgi:hypothetical protein
VVLNREGDRNVQHVIVNPLQGDSRGHRGEDKQERCTYGEKQTGFRISNHGKSNSAYTYVTTSLSVKAHPSRSAGSGRSFASSNEKATSDTMGQQIHNIVVSLGRAQSNTCSQSQASDFPAKMHILLR